MYLKEEIPPKGSKILLENFEFEIKQAALTKIERVLLRIKYEK